jgi:hypothetical protein
MTETRIKHISEIELADYLSRSLDEKKRDAASRHLAECPECLEKMVLSYDSVKEFQKNSMPGNRKGTFMKRINIYLILALVSFLLSFITPRYFLQFLVATIVLGAKWVVDSKTTRMLIMIQEAFKKGGEKEASRILKTLDSSQKTRF